MPDRLDTLEDVTRSVIGHQAQNVAWWHEQRRVNDAVDRRIEALIDKVEQHGALMRALERKVYLMAGAAAAGGSIFGNIAQGWFAG